jgi:AAA domain/Bifunctional DNA primase/polymerase, N-terminal/Winged helix-turn-helix DNA-binding
MTLLSTAQQLTNQGLSVVPVVHGQKRPSCEWKIYQSRIAQFGELVSWFGGNQNMGMGVVCGAVSNNLVCLDFDSKDAAKHFADDPHHAELMKTAAIAESSRGIHVFFRSTEPVASQALYLAGWEGKAGDLLSEGKFAVLPPTLHPDGFRRNWVRNIIVPGQKIPIISMQDLNLAKPPKETPEVQGHGEGDRHNSMVRFAKENAHRTEDLNDLVCLMLVANEDRCHPPLPYDEILGIAKYFRPSDLLPHPKRINKEELNSYTSSFFPNTMSKSEEQSVDTIFLAAPEYAKDRVDSPMTWVVEGMLPMGYLVVLGATSKSGKSCLVTNLAHAVASGTEFLGMPTNQGAVLWLAYEESESERNLVLANYDPLSPNMYISHEKIILDSETGMTVLRHWIQRTNAKLLVIDPLYGAVQAESLSDGRKARTALEGLKELCRTENVTAIVLHHFTKNVSVGSTRERFADSNQILATASMDWIMETRPQADQTREIRLLGAGRGAFANKTWLILSRSDHEYELIASGSTAECEQDHIELQMISLIQEFDHGATAEELSSRLGIALSTTRNRLTQLVKANKITVIGKQGKMSVYGAERVLVGAE